MIENDESSKHKILKSEEKNKASSSQSNIHQKSSQSKNNQMHPIKNPNNVSKKSQIKILQGGKPIIKQPKSSRTRQNIMNQRYAKNVPKSAKGRINTPNSKLNPMTREVLMNPLSMPKEYNELQIVLKDLEKLQQFHIESQNYPEAEGIQKLIQSTKKRMKFASSKPPEVENTVLKHKELQQIVQKILTQWNEQFDEFLSTTESEYENLVAKHEKELKEFDAHAPEELTPQYRKRSAALIELRNKEKILANVKQYEAAESLRVKNDKTENNEALQQYDRMQKDYLKKRERLIARQEEQVRVFLSHAESERSNLLQSRANLLEGYLKRMNKLNTEIDVLCKEQKISLDDLDMINLPIDRVIKIEKIESEGVPIPTLRQGTFTSIRQQIRKQRIAKEKRMERRRKRKQKQQEDEIATIAPFVTTSALDQFKHVEEVIAEEEEEEINENEAIPEEEIKEELIEEEEIKEELIEEEEIKEDLFEEEEIKEDIHEEEVEEMSKEEEEVLKEDVEEENNEPIHEEELNQPDNEVDVYNRNDVADITFFTSTIATFANETNQNQEKKWMDPDRHPDVSKSGIS